MDAHGKVGCGTFCALLILSKCAGFVEYWRESLCSGITRWCKYCRQWWRLGCEEIGPSSRIRCCFCLAIKSRHVESHITLALPQRVGL
ncbi:hypothetical protein BD309DRAFT_960589 [Dichomitus squalens]|uniref:Uncharacterized protein n=1 Tax=Dichomitus squalens TaxID=114155 RepID=A0A4Q9NPQ9_9APHY|nr:hypothetical protein BD309DRAFT_960589 [Dichomitus squalens]TBU60157.1 hypothetical protein BD310DRAFT_923449 [Dichomitus squalens]